MKKISLFLIVSLLLIFTSSASAALTFGREKLRSTSKTQGDFNNKNTSNSAVRKVTCDCQYKDGKCYCECPCPACAAAPATTTAAPAAIAPKAATGKGTSGGGGTIKAK